MQDGFPHGLLTIILAPFIGSFLGLLIHRLPHGRPVILARSQCPHCHHALRPWDLLPLASWAVLGGRCRYCRAPIAWFYPAIELAATGVALWAALATPGSAAWTSVVLGWTLLALAIIDWRHYLLPNALTLPLLAAGLVASFFLSGPVLLDHVVGAALGFSTLALIAYAYQAIRKRDGLGMGDAKLLAAGGAWLGWQGLPSVLLMASVAALVYVAISAARGQRWRGTDFLPFGSYLSLAIWIVWLYGPIQW